MIPKREAARPQIARVVSTCLAKNGERARILGIHDDLETPRRLRTRRLAPRNPSAAKPFGEAGMDMGVGQPPDAGVVDGQHRSMSLGREGRPDRIGSLFDAACPTAATPDTGRTERLLPSQPSHRAPADRAHRAAGRPAAGPPVDVTSAQRILTSW